MYLYLYRGHWSSKGLPYQRGAPVVSECSLALAKLCYGTRWSQLGWGTVVSSTQHWHIIYGRSWKDNTKGALTIRST